MSLWFCHNCKTTLGFNEARRHTCSRPMVERAEVGTSWVYAADMEMALAEATASTRAGTSFFEDLIDALKKRGVEVR